MLKDRFHAHYREVGGIDLPTCDLTQLIPLSYLYHDLYGLGFITHDETDYGSCKQHYERSQDVAVQLKACLRKDISLCDRVEAILALLNAFYTILDVQWLNETLSQTEDIARLPHESCEVLEKTALCRLYSMYAHYIPDSSLRTRAADLVHFWSEAQLPSGSWGGEFSDHQALAVLHAVNEYGYLTQDGRYEETVARGVAYYTRRIATKIHEYTPEEKMCCLEILYWLRSADAPGAPTALLTCREIASEVNGLLENEKIASAGWLQGVALLGNYVTETTLDEFSENLSSFQPEASGE